MATGSFATSEITTGAVDKSATPVAQAASHEASMRLAADTHVPQTFAPQNFAPAAARIGDVQTGNLAVNKGVSELVEAGVMRRSDLRPSAGEPLKAGERPQVVVTYTNTADASGKAVAPDFIVKKNGQIEAVGDFEAANKRQVVIQVERQPGQAANPRAEQQKAIDNLTQYVYGRVSVRIDVAASGLDIKDQYGLLSNNLTAKIADGRLAGATVSSGVDRSAYSPETQRVMGGMDRFEAGTGGSLSPREVAEYFPRRDVGQQSDESNQVVHAKNGIAAMFNPDHDKPYETQRQNGDQGMAVGRYGLGAANFYNWLGLSEGDLDEDNLAAAMADKAKHGKVSKEFAAKFKDKNFAHRFITSMKRMHDGKQLSSEELRTFVPKELQERVATDTVDSFLKSTQGDIGKTALAMHLGKEPGQLSGEELNNKANKEYMQGAVRLTQFSEARRNMNSGDQVEWQVGPEGTAMQARIVKAGMQVARDMNSTFACAEGVQRALAKAGMPQFLGSGDGWEMRHAFLNSPEWKVTNDPTKATAVVRAWTPEVTRSFGNQYGGRNLGHVALLHNDHGRIIETSDHATVHDVNNPRYAKSIYFEYVGKNPQTMEA